MDHNAFTTGLARQAGLSVDDTRGLVSALVNIITNASCNLDNVAIPGFGRFEAVKTDEFVDVDLSDGVKKLFPPRVSVNFIPGSKLKKRINNE